MVQGWGSEWFLRYLELKEMLGPWHASGSAPESGISNFKFSCKTILNKSENATPELFAIYIQNDANQ